jgi:hypothetical protein
VSDGLNLDPEIERCRDSVAKLQGQLETIRQSLTKEQERLNLLEKLRSLDEPTFVPETSTPNENAKSLEDAVVSYLASGKAMHISRIRARLLKDGIPIPGKGVDANVIARIRRDSRIARAPGQRGYYVLEALARFDGRN